MRYIVAERRGATGQSGQSVVELAMVLPVLLLLLVGMAEFAQLAGAYLTVQHSVREGLRTGLTGSADVVISDRVRQMAPNLDQTLFTVTVTPAGATRLPGTDLAVQATYRFQVSTPLIAQVTGGEIPLTATLVGRVE